MKKKKRILKKKIREKKELFLEINVHDTIKGKSVGPGQS